VGENTFPNAVPFMSGYSESDIRQICFLTKETPQDDCPYIWKRFSTANYLTAYAEDSPRLGAFNYLKTGFVKQPVDFYLRPFFLPIYEAKKYLQPGTVRTNLIQLILILQSNY
jgi:hypothetical protein